MQHVDAKPRGPGVVRSEHEPPFDYVKRIRIFLAVAQTASELAIGLHALIDRCAGVPRYRLEDCSRFAYLAVVPQSRCACHPELPRGLHREQCAGVRDNRGTVWRRGEEFQQRALHPNVARMGQQRFLGTLPVPGRE